MNNQATFIPQLKNGNKSAFTYIINDIQYSSKQQKNYQPYFINNKYTGVFDIDKDTHLKNLNTIYSRCK